MRWGSGEGTEMILHSEVWQFLRFVTVYIILQEGKYCSKHQGIFPSFWVS